MKLIRSSRKGADFVDDETKELYFEYLENETMMPYDMIDKYVYDFAHMMETIKKFQIWKLNHYPDLPFE